MQNVSVITVIGRPPVVEIEGVGTVRQIEVAEKLYTHGVIDWSTRMKSGKIALCSILVQAAVNKFNLYPKQF
jgi:hypothetical protein